MTLGGRRVAVRRPRVRAADGSGEIAVPAYELFNSTELLGEMAMAKMLAKLSTRRYRAGLEPVGAEVDKVASSTSKSAVSRRFVTATETALADLLGADLSGLDLVALMVDGVHFADHLLVVAMGIGIDGTKHPLAVVEGSTENATLVTDLLVGLRDRGLDVTRPMLVVIDGAKALAGGRAGGVRPSDHRPLPTAQGPQRQGETAQGPGDTVASKMRAAYRLDSALAAQAALEDLARQLDKTHPGAAGVAARGTRRDPHRHAPRRAAHPGPHAALDEPDRVDDRDLPGSQLERQTLARRPDGLALVRGGDARSHQTVPQSQRLLTPARPTPSPRRRSRQDDRHTHRIRSRRGLNSHGTVTEVPRNSGHPQFGTGDVEWTQGAAGSLLQQPEYVPSELSASSDSVKRSIGKRQHETWHNQPQLSCLLCAGHQARRELPAERGWRDAPERSATMSQ